MSVKITNICALFTIDCQLNLENILTNDNFSILTNKKYNKQNFSGLIAKYKSTKTTFLIFHTGKICITGGQSIYQINNLVNELINCLNTNGYNATLNYLKFTNFCGSGKLLRHLTTKDIQLIKQTFNLNCEYETEIFPSIKFNYENFKYTITRKGIVFATGFKSINSTIENIKKVVKLINETIS